MAAGRGKRIGATSAEPKVLKLLCGRPIMSFLLDNLRQSDVKTKPVIVIAPDLDIIKKTFGSSYDYAIQEEQLGTGHAVLSAKDQLRNFEHILVLYGDMPNLKPETINKLVTSSLGSRSILTMATVRVSDFDDWRKGFYDFGRIMRDDLGAVAKIMEKKDCSLQELEIHEVNPSYFCFRADWLWQNISKLRNDNNQKEYYLTDLAGLACSQKEKITTVEIDPKEALGVNTLEQLILVEDMK